MKLFNKDGKEYEFEAFEGTSAGNLKELNPKPEQWQCPEGDWYVDIDNNVIVEVTLEMTRVVGNEYPTKEKAQQAGDRRTELEIINQCIMYWQEKLEPDWVCDYSNCIQVKHTLMGYSHDANRWFGTDHNLIETPYLPCSFQVKNKVLELLNKGLVEGVKR